MSYKNYTWEVAAKDYNSPFFRNRLWTHSFFKYPKLVGISRAVLGIISKENQIEYLADFSTWMKAHEDLKAKVTKDFRAFDELIQKSIDWGERMNKWTENEIYKKDLTKYPNEKLTELLYNFIDMQEDEYAYGTALPILDFIGFSFVEGNLSKFLKEKVPADKYQEYYTAFTEPEHNSFALDQEIDLLKLMAKYWQERSWREDISSKNLAEIEKIHPKFFKDLEVHTEKHGWVYYVYAGPAFTTADFLNFIRDYLRKKVEPKQKLAELTEKSKQVKVLKEKYLEELEPDPFNKFILQIAGKVVWAKPRRKDYQSRSYYHVEKLLLEIGNRLSLSLEQVRSIPYEMLEKGLQGEKLDPSYADTVKHFHACLPNDDGSVALLLGEEAEEFSKTVKRKSEESKAVSELKGTTACKGEAKGTVRIINKPEDMAKMNYGDILVSTATTPSVVPAMKKAAAIVTDEGGLTCHAAIVSRELGIPCVVGTKIATKVLKDGLTVMVDASKGLVTILDK